MPPVRPPIPAPQGPAIEPITAPDEAPENNPDNAVVKSLVCWLVSLFCTAWFTIVDIPTRDAESTDLPTSPLDSPGTESPPEEVAERFPTGPSKPAKDCPWLRIPIACNPPKTLSEPLIRANTNENILFTRGIANVIGPRTVMMLVAPLTIEVKKSSKRVRPFSKPPLPPRILIAFTKLLFI